MYDPTVDFVRAHYGIITRAQALALGLTRHQIQRRLDHGTWVPIAPGVYRHPLVEHSWKSRLLAACMVHRGIASHRSAAVLWGLDGWRPGRPEIIVAAHRSLDSATCHIHETTQWDRRGESSIDEIPVTGLARTLLDLSAVAGFRRVRASVEDARARRLVTDEELESTLRRHARRGRDGTVRFRRVLEVCLITEPPKSDWSHRVADLISSSGLPRPSLEHRVALPAGPVYIDLAYPNLRLGFELDSHAFHSTKDELDRDARRRNRLTNAGWTMHSFTYTQFRDRPAELVDVVRAARRRAESQRRAA